MACILHRNRLFSLATLPLSDAAFQSILEDTRYFRIPVNWWPLPYVDSYKIIHIEHTTSNRGLVSLGDSLLKLTEIPFSYSLMGIAFLIIGKPLDLGNFSYTDYAPLILVAGFLATTLSITDPGAHLIRFRLRRRDWDPVDPAESNGERQPFISMHVMFPESYIRADLRRIREERAQLQTRLQDIERHAPQSTPAKRLNEMKNELKALDERENVALASLFAKELREEQGKVLETRWIGAEIDSIVAMSYFLIVILVFQLALIFGLLTVPFSDMLKNLFSSWRVEDFLIGTSAGLFIAMGGVVAKIVYSCRHLIAKVRTVSVYFLAIRKNWSLTNAIVVQLKENISAKDWGMAGFLTSRILKVMEEKAQPPET